MHDEFIELLNRATSNDAQAIQDLMNHPEFDRMVSYLGNILAASYYRVWNGDQDIEDLKQEIRIRVCYKISTFKNANSKGAFFVWMRTMAFRLSVDRSRRRQPYWQAGEHFEFKDSPSQADDWVKHWISSLPETEREVMRLLVVEKYSLRDAGEELQLSHSAVRYHRNKALNSLRRRMERAKQLARGAGKKSV